MAGRSRLRTVFAVLAMLLIVFSGGCGLFWLAVADGVYVTWQAVLVFTAPPVLIGALVFWLARREKPSDTAGEHNP